MTKAGLLRDGINSVRRHRSSFQSINTSQSRTTSSRYYENHVLDPSRQEGLDLLLSGRREASAAARTVASASARPQVPRVYAFDDALTLILTPEPTLDPNISPHAVILYTLQVLAAARLAGLFLLLAIFIIQALHP